MGPEGSVTCGLYSHNLYQLKLSKFQTEKVKHGTEEPFLIPPIHLAISYVIRMSVAFAPSMGHYNYCELPELGTQFCFDIHR